jgi:hypothetical protein
MENEEADSALEAINEALGVPDEEPEASGLEEDAEAGDEGAEAGDEAGEDEGAEAGEDEGADEGEGTDEERAAAAKAERERGEDGKFKKTEAKKPDPVNDPIPKDLKKETSERMQSLIKTVKEITTERDQVRTEFDTIINGIKATGATPEQYGEAISWLGMFNSPDPATRVEAYKLVNEVAERMATLLGIDRTATDPVAQHADLKAAVAAGKITQEYAREIARVRNAQKFNGEIQNGQRQQQQTQQQQEAERAQSKAELNAFETEMREKDPLYELKKAQIVPILRPIFKTLPRKQWAAAFKEAYANAKVQPKGTPKPKVQQPLRGGKNPAGGQIRQPTSMMEAINGALAGMK